MEKTQIDLLTECYRTMYEGMIQKDEVMLTSVLDERFTLTHMTGMKQSRAQFIKAIQDGTLNYYSETPDSVNITGVGSIAYVVGRSRVDAAVFGGERHTWRLQLTMRASLKNGKWSFAEAVASTY